MDTDAEVAAIDRSLAADGKQRTATVSRSFRTGIDNLWQACTTADRLARWFQPVSGELTPGGRYQIEGNAGGTVESCDPPRGFTVTWEFGGQIGHLAATMTEDGPGRSRLTLSHSADVDPDFWEQFGPGAVGVGWDLSMLGLGMHLETGQDKPVEGSGWETSGEGRAFITGSSRAWADAAVAVGTPEQDARAAEARTTAFYTGA
jgi:uncharacterized protein YndB with AHSA1/START domain